MPIELIQVCAYANWANESFEIWRFYPPTMSQKEISKQMLSLFNGIFSEIVTNKAIEDLNQASLTIGGTDDIMEFDSVIGHDLMERISYGWYFGKVWM